jgi:hypothetical protein
VLEKVDNKQYDIIIGPISDDLAAENLIFFTKGKTEAAVGLKNLLAEKSPSVQYCFRTVKALALLEFSKHEIVR